jgi:hypothetical protein
MGELIQKKRLLVSALIRAKIRWSEFHIILVLQFKTETFVSF